MRTIRNCLSAPGLDVRISTARSGSSVPLDVNVVRIVHATMFSPGVALRARIKALGRAVPLVTLDLSAVAKVTRTPFLPSFERHLDGLSGKASGLCFGGCMKL